MIEWEQNADEWRGKYSKECDVIIWANPSGGYQMVSMWDNGQCWRGTDVETAKEIALAQLVTWRMERGNQT
jgi:hypothetical protein